MSQIESQTFDVPQSVAAGDALALKPFNGVPTVTFDLNGATMTAKMQVADTSTGPWFDAGSAFSASTLVNINYKARFARVNVTAYTSGQGLATIAGHIGNAASNVALTDVAQQYTKAHVGVPVDLGVAVTGTQAIVASDGNVWKGTVTGAVVVGLPSELRDGQNLTLRLKQGSGGSKAITFASGWDWGTGGAPNTAADAAGTTLIVTAHTDGTSVFAGFKAGFTL